VPARREDGKHALMFEDGELTIDLDEAEAQAGRPDHKE
jgi:hypothetical protein